VTRQLALLRVLLPLLAAALLGVAAWLVIERYIWDIFWSMLGFTPLFIVGCEMWRRQIVRNEAVRPFVTSPAPELGSSPERKALEGPKMLALPASSSEGR